MAGTGRLQIIDVLRGVAALAVLILHIPHRLPNYGQAGGWGNWLLLPIEFGGLGVTLFILLSGFCIHANTLRSAPSSDAPLRPRWGAFWKRRFVRLYPPYFAAILLSLGVLAFIWGRCGPVHSLTRDYAEHGWSRLGWDLLAHLFMVHNLTADFALGLGNGPLWSLGMEEQLYLLYFVFLTVHRSWGWRGLVTLGVVLVGAWVGWQAFGLKEIAIGPLRVGHWHTWPFNFWLMWILGAHAAEAHVGRVRLPTWARSATLAVALGLLHLSLSGPLWTVLTGQDSVIQWLIPTGSALAPWIKPLSILLDGVNGQMIALAFYITLNIGVARERQTGASPHPVMCWLAGIGLFSYSLYLTHVLVIAVAETALKWHYVSTWSRLPWRLLGYPPLCLWVAWLFFKLVEERFLRRAANSRLDIKNQFDVNFTAVRDAA
jgi:peptidoglycan/LPS O-acetylase OafA/YrhL